MAKIYVNSKTKKLSDEGTIILEKKYVKVQEYLLSVFLIPNVLINIVMEYINYDFVVKYRLEDEELYITEITQTDINKELIINECSILHNHYLNSDFVYVYHDQTFPSAEINYKPMLSCTAITGYFNCFMKKYYKKQNYISKYTYNCHIHDNYIDYSTDCYDISIKTINYKEIKNIIVIFKILCNLMKKLTFSTY